MKNLASHDESESAIAATDTQLIAELTAAGVTCEVQPSKNQGEVPTRIIGKAKGFVFDRRWYYWAVDGKVPLHVAQVIYKSEVGRLYVRVAGHCMCPPPEEWAHTYEKSSGLLVQTDEEYEKGLRMFTGEAEWQKDLLKKWTTECVPASKVVGETEKFVESYHIDSAEGLKLFVDTLKIYNII